MQRVSRKTVTKWVDAGRVQLVVRDGRELIDPVVAAVSLKSTLQRAEQLKEILDEPVDVKGKGAAPTLTQLKAHTEEERAALLRLDRLEREGALVSAENVAMEQETAARLVRKAIDAIPSRAEDIATAAAKGGVLAVRKELRAMVREVEAAMARALMDAADQVEASRSIEDMVDAA